MCCEDVKIGRKSRMVVTSILVDNSKDWQLCQANPNRIGLVIGTPAASSLGIAPLNAPTGHGLIFVSTTTGAFILNGPYHGGAVTAAWTGKMTAGSSSILVIETILDDMCNE